MCKTLKFIALFLAYSSCSRADFAENVAAFEKQGFRCLVSEHSGAMTCVGGFGKDYPEEVAFIVPQAHRKAGSLNFILHLIGNQTAEVAFEKDVLAMFKFDELLLQSGRREILIVPGNRGPRLTYRDEFMCHPKDIRERKLQGALLDQCRRKGEAGFSRFMQHALRVLGKAGLAGNGKNVDRLTLSGHSGAFAPMAAILEHPAFKGKIHEVYCFDCMYGDEDVFSRYAKTCPPNRFLSVAIRGERTDLGNFRVWGALHPSVLEALLKEKGAELQKIKSETDQDERQKNLNSFDAELLKKTNFETDTSRPVANYCGVQRAVFSSDTSDHDGTVARYFPVFLKECPKARPLGASASDGHSGH